MKPFLNEGDKPCHNSISHVSTADSITLKVSFFQLKMHWIGNNIACLVIKRNPRVWWTRNQNGNYIYNYKSVESANRSSIRMLVAPHPNFRSQIFLNSKSEGENWLANNFLHANLELITQDFLFKPFEIDLLTCNRKRHYCKLSGFPLDFFA